MKYSPEDLRRFRELERRMRAELESDILPFWLPYVDRSGGGFYGLVRNDGSFDALAPKGLVMHSRFLWAYSAAYIRYAKREYLEAARAAYGFLRGGQRDELYGGFWWVVDAPDDRGSARPRVEVKMIYGQAFAIYALSEYYLATGEKAALDLALETYALLERAARDRDEGGYCEACDRSWTRAIRFALSDTDIACDKSMNTNLHVLEALSNLYRASLGKDVRESLVSLLEVYAKKAFAGKPNLSLYFDRDWKSLSDHVSWGHDIESSWLMTEAAHLAYGRGKAPSFVREAIRAAREGILPVLEANGGSLPRERAEGHTDLQRDWWVQAEAVVGNVDAWQETGESAYLSAAIRLWNYIEEKVLDRERGEWFWGISAEGTPAMDRPKGGLWKTCYHNGRACLEIMERSERIRNGNEEAAKDAGRRRKALEREYRALIRRPNGRIEPGNGIFWRYRNPVLTAAHAPLSWRYDFDPERNPYFMERLGVNAVFYAGAIKLDGRYCLLCRVEGADRKSFFALAESPNGVDNFRFTGEPVLLDDPSGSSSAASPEGDPRANRETNVYDMRLTRHEDGWIYGIFCVGYSDSMTDARIEGERLLDPRLYHTIKEAKNGAGAPPIKTSEGWIHFAHGVRVTAAGLRYVIYAFLAALDDPTRVIASPGGYLIAPEGGERVGDVSNVVFANGAICDPGGRLLLYYASSDSRLHVAESSVDRMLDYLRNTPRDGLYSRASVEARTALIRRNNELLR